MRRRRMVLYSTVRRKHTVVSNDSSSHAVSAYFLPSWLHLASVTSLQSRHTQEMGCSGSKHSVAAGERDGLTGAAGEAVGEAVGGVTAAAAAVVGGVADAARASAEAVPAFPRQLLEHVHDATGAFARATVRTGELVAAATAQVTSKADFMARISQPEVRASRQSSEFRVYSSLHTAVALQATPGASR